MMKRSCLFASMLASVLMACGPSTPPVVEDAGNPPAPVPDAGTPEDAGTPTDDGGAPDVTPPPAECGNGTVETGEACDDGNQVQTDACKNNCQFNVCGDGFLYSNQEQCDDGNSINGDGCSSVCLPEEPVPVTVNVQGTLRKAHYVESEPAIAATVRATNVDSNGDGIVNSADQTALTSVTNATGGYTLNALPPGSVVVTQAKGSENACTLAGVPNCAEPPAFATRSVIKTYNNESETAELPIVDFQWWMEQAVRCGVFADEAEAYAGRTLYSGIMGRLEASDGSPVQAVGLAGISLSVEGYANTGSVCFLERYNAGTPNDPSDDKYRVALNASEQPVVQSTDTGLFAIFKTRSGAGFGLGEHVVSAPTFAETRLSLTAGQVGYIKLTTANPPIAPEDLIDFESAVFPVFRRNGCVACHFVNGPGAVSPADAPGQYPMILDGDASAVYQSIIGPSGAGARVNFDSPADSLLIQMPLLEDPPNHPNASFETVQVADAALLINWISQGAPRYAAIVDPVGDEPLTLTELIETSNYVGCVGCHYAEREADFNTSVVGQPYGELPLDGCIPFYNYPAEYAPTDNTLPVASQPTAENQRCVYYHLAKQQVATDPYGTNYRVNTAEPDKSLLLRNPYCGLYPDDYACNDEVTNPMESHPVRLFFSKTEGPYLYMKTWIENGAPNDGEYGDGNTGIGTDAGPGPSEDAGPSTDGGGPSDGGTP